MEQTAPHADGRRLGTGCRARGVGRCHGRRSGLCTGTFTGARGTGNSGCPRQGAVTRGPCSWPGLQTGTRPWGRVGSEAASAGRRGRRPRASTGCSEGLSVGWAWESQCPLPAGNPGVTSQSHVPRPSSPLSLGVLGDPPSVWRVITSCLCLLTFSLGWPQPGHCHPRTLQQSPGLSPHGLLLSCLRHKASHASPHTNTLQCSWGARDALPGRPAPCSPSALPTPASHGKLRPRGTSPIPEHELCPPFACATASCRRLRLPPRPLVLGAGNPDPIGPHACELNGFEHWPRPATHPAREVTAYTSVWVTRAQHDT